MRIATRNADRPTGRILRVRATDLLCGLLTALAFAPLALHAQTAPASAAFSAGRAAFERGDFEAALVAFEAALDARMDGPAVHYNVGVAAYKVKRYDRAARAFEEVARTPSMAALAHYNLGLVAKAQGQTQAARDSFARAFAEAQDERLRSLARASLEDLGAPPQVASSRPVWAGFGAASVGYDDNVALTSSGQALGVSRDSDAYFDGLFAGSVQFGDKWRIDADASYLKYAELTEFDQIGVGAGARYRIQADVWTTDVGAQLGATFVDGDRFDQRQSLLVQGGRRLAERWSTRARYRISNVDGVDAYEGLDGLRHELSGRLTYRNEAWSGSATYLFDLSDFESAALSATRHQLVFDARKGFTPAWTGRATLGFRTSEYEDASVGDENRIEASIAVEHALTEQATLVLQYSYTDSNSDVNELDYERNRFQLGAELTF